MQKFFKSSDGLMYMDVSAKAFAIYDTKIFDLYAVWQKEDNVYRIPITERDDIQVALDYHKFICIEVPYKCQCNVDKWADADKIIHDGYIYVRYSDIRP